MIDYPISGTLRTFMRFNPMSEKQGFFLLCMSMVFLIGNITRKPIKENKTRKHFGF